MKTDAIRDKIGSFANREKLYLVLLLFVIIINAFFSITSGAIKEAGLSRELYVTSGADEGAAFEMRIMDALQSDSALYDIFAKLIIVFIFFLLLGIIIDVAFLYKKWRKAEDFKKTEYAESAKWDLWDVCKVIIIFLFAESIAYLINIYLSLFGLINPQNSLHLVINATALDFVAVFATLYFVLYEKRNTLKSLGLTAKNFFLNIKYGLSAYLGLIPIFVAVTIAMSIIFQALNIPVEPQDVVEILKKEKNMGSLIYMAFFTSILGPVMEEIFFRGFLYGALKRKAGVLAGILISAAFFALVHSNLASFMPILCLGVLLAYIYEKTGSLVSSITAHILHNSVMLCFLLFLKSVIN